MTSVSVDVSDREVLAGRLRELARQAETRDASWREAVAARNELMREAAGAGWSNPEIAEATGQSLANVKLICTGARIRP